MEMRTGAELLPLAVKDIAAAAGAIGDSAVNRLVEAILAARHIALFGCGREGLQMRGLAMRLHHLGRSVSVAGDMTTPAIGPGDLLLLSAGPGMLSTALALANVAKGAGAKVLTITAQPDGAVPKASDEVVVVPAQTMATDREGEASALPMGSVYEGALFLMFEIVVLLLKERLGVSDAFMRANHTNLE
jgi:6-phospho-3-hexuloisomerase